MFAKRLSFLQRRDQFFRRLSTRKEESIHELPSGIQNSWKVNDSFIEECSRLVPASPDDVSDEIKAALLVTKGIKGREWYDFDEVKFILGEAMGIFPPTSTLDSLKWVFWTDNSLNQKLNNLVLALAREESDCLESRTQPDFQFRKRYVHQVDVIPQVEEWKEVYDPLTDRSYKLNVTTGQILQNQ